MKKSFRYIYATLLRRMLVLLSLPLLASSCHTPRQQQTIVPATDSVKLIPDPNDPSVLLPADTIDPNYFDPNTICEYGVPRSNPEYDTIHEQLMYGVIRVE